MKNTFKYIMVAVAALVMTSCDGKKEDEKKGDDKKTEASAKGKWSEADLKKAYDAIGEADADLDQLGEYKQEFIDCYVSKIQNNYESFEAADKDQAGCESFAMECASEIMAKIEPEMPEEGEEGEGSEDEASTEETK